MGNVLIWPAHAPSCISERNVAICVDKKVHVFARKCFVQSPEKISTALHLANSQAASSTYLPTHPAMLGKKERCFVCFKQL